MRIFATILILFCLRASAQLTWVDVTNGSDSPLASPPAGYYYGCYQYPLADITTAALATQTNGTLGKIIVNAGWYHNNQFFLTNGSLIIYFREGAIITNDGSQFDFGNVYGIGSSISFLGNGKFSGYGGIGFGYSPIQLFYCNNTTINFVADACLGCGLFSGYIDGYSTNTTANCDLQYFDWEGVSNRVITGGEDFANTKVYLHCAQYFNQGSEFMDYQLNRPGLNQNASNTNTVFELSSPSISLMTNYISMPLYGTLKIDRPATMLMDSNLTLIGPQGYLHTNWSIAFGGVHLPWGINTNGVANPAVLGNISGTFYFP